MRCAPSLVPMLEFFGWDEDWERPRPVDWLRRDTVVAGIFLVWAVMALECQRALGLPHGVWPRWGLYAGMAAGVVPLVWRRRYPITMMLLMMTHMFVFGLAQPIVMSNMAVQAAYFFGLFTAMAWAENRQAVVLAAGGVIVFMFGWLAVEWSRASMLDQLVENMGGHRGDHSHALFGPGAGAVIYNLLMNAAFFFTAVGAGANSWRGARARAHAEEQAATITQQTERLAEQAVVEERLRIARELHDVVAHHVSAMGIQAAAGRKLLVKDPERACEALTNVEASSREAVTQMRSLLGTLRSGEKLDAAERVESSDGPARRAPEPSLADLPALIEECTADWFTVTYTDDLGSGADRVSSGMGHSLYRTVQEALANVRRHSTATSATVTLRGARRDGQDFVEVEILDEGRPRAGTSGSGLGLMGMRERIRAHHGEAEIGPRVTGGYRVRVRLPLEPAGEKVAA